MNTNNATNHLPSNLKALRLSRGLTQRELDELSGTSSVAMIESGRRSNPSIEIVEALARALGVPISRLLRAPMPKRARANS